VQLCFAATAAGIYNKVEDAMAAMGTGFDAEYAPQQSQTCSYMAKGMQSIFS